MKKVKTAAQIIIALLILGGAERFQYGRCLGDFG